MNEAKVLLVPATLAYAGTRVAAQLGATGAITQILVGIAGAAAGLWLAKKV